MSAQTEVTKFAEDLIETPKPHLRLRLYQDSNGLKLSMDKDLLIFFIISKPSIVLENGIVLPSDNFISGIYQDNSINFLYSVKVV